MKEKELNKKRAKWAGFMQTNFKKDGLGFDWFTDPNGHGCELPRFPKDLNACLKWFKAPLLRELGYERYCDFIKDWADEFTLHNEEPAKAFCEAIDDLILHKAVS